MLKKTKSVLISISLFTLSALAADNYFHEKNERELLRTIQKQSNFYFLHALIPQEYKNQVRPKLINLYTSLDISVAKEAEKLMFRLFTGKEFILMTTPALACAIEKTQPHSTPAIIRILDKTEETLIKDIDSVDFSSAELDQLKKEFSELCSRYQRPETGLLEQAIARKKK